MNISTQTGEIKNPFPGQLASTQLNVVTVVDVLSSLASDTIVDNSWMMDNSPDSRGKGTNKIETVCRAGQVLNWLIYNMNTDKRDDGTWPPFAKIVNIVFLRDDREVVFGTKVCADLKVYGGPDAVRSRYTPSYYYWAGSVMPNLAPGLYAYRLVLELETDKPGEVRHYNLDGPSLRVIPMEHSPE
jgi:hypothetical protein